MKTGSENSNEENQPEEISGFYVPHHKPLKAHVIQIGSLRLHEIHLIINSLLNWVCYLLMSSIAVSYNISFLAEIFPREPSVMIYDASQGISFVCNNIAEYGGDPNR